MNKEANFHFDGSNVQEVNEIGDFKENEDIIVHKLFVNAIMKQCFNESKDSKSEDLMRKAIYEITIGIDNDEEVAEFLDSIDSTFVYHKNIKKMSKREHLCLFMNTICKWSVVFKNNNSYYEDNQIIPISELYNEYKLFINEELGYSKRKFISYEDFRQHLKHHACVKPAYTTFQGERLSVESIVGLPQKQ